MRVVSILENQKIEKRIAITPDIAKKYIALGFKISIVEKYGEHLGFKDSDYKELGVEILTNKSEVLNSAKDIAVSNELLFDSYQVSYNVFEQSAFDALQELKTKGKTIIIKEALANGRVFTNKHAMKQLETLSKTYNVGPDSIALRFVIDTLQPTMVLSGASNPTHLVQNLKALDFKLSLDDLELLKSLKTESKMYWNERSDLAWN